MVFWKKRRHKLPKFPPSLIPGFNKLRQAYREELMKELPQALGKRMQELENEAKTNKKVNLELARDIFERCNFLLGQAEDQDEKKRAVIYAAVAYFAIEGDSFSDTAFAVGLHDDARIINYVLEEIGAEGQFIEL